MLLLKETMDTANVNWQEELLGSLGTLRVVTGFDQHWHPLRMIRPHSHDYFQLDYFYEGHGTMTIRDADREVRPGDVFVCNPGDVHKYRAAKEKPMGSLTLKFENRGQSPFFLPNYLGNLSLLPRDHKRDLENQLARACVEANKSAAESLMLASAFGTVFFVMLVGCLRELDRIEANKSLDNCAAVLDYIKRHYDRQITLDDLSRIAKMHPKYLCHKFAVQMGMPPIQALARERIEAAKRLLRNTTVPISEIALRVGYVDIAHFSKRFRELTGSSPREFRKIESALFREVESSTDEA